MQNNQAEDIKELLLKFKFWSREASERIQGVSWNQLH